ncbi:MAG: MBL fold metallo-hydrolase, partial [Acidimicrobiales bacterium]
TDPPEDGPAGPAGPDPTAGPVPTAPSGPDPAAGLGRPEDWLPPTPDRGVAHGDTIVLGGRTWTCLHTPGHTLDHLCLHDPRSGIVLSGDHVLPTITPHISGIGSGRDPLAAFLASLDRMAALPGVELVLPAHGQPFADLPGRVAEIRAHHEGRLDRLRDVVAATGEATVAEASHELFRPDHWGPMAESETYAHLEHLRLAGLVERGRRGGLAVYRPNGSEAAGPEAAAVGSGHGAGAGPGSVSQDTTSG